MYLKTAYWVSFHFHGVGADASYTVYLTRLFVYLGQFLLPNYCGGLARSSFLNLANGRYNQNFACAMTKHVSRFMLQNVAVMTHVLDGQHQKVDGPFGAGYNLEVDR